MRHNVRQEFKATMDALHFSQETKEDMVKLLMSQTKETNMNQKYFHKKGFCLWPWRRP